MFFRKAFFVALLLMLALDCGAQRKKKNATPPPPTAEELAEMARLEKYNRRLQTVECVTFIDSVLVTKDMLMGSINLGKETGSISEVNDFFNLNSENTEGCYLFQTQLDDKIIFSQPTPGGVLQLFASEKIGNQWAQAVSLKGLNDTIHCNYPFMMADGVTLYYASTNEEGLGGYDIYMTRWDDDLEMFLKPENLGMPFNSPANDYLYIIDEFNNIGWFVTDRGQVGDTVCIYNFIPNKTRKIYDPNIIGHDTLVAYANINSIQDTWTDKVLVQDALERLMAVKQKNTKVDRNQFHFVVNDNIIYTNMSHFRNHQSKKLAEQWVEMRNAREKHEVALAELREEYHKADAEKRKRLTATIISLEQENEQLGKKILMVEKEIRTYESR